PTPALGWHRRDLAPLPRRFEAFWNDHFGFRPRLIRWHNLVKLRLGIAPSDVVYLGRNGWLFLRSDNRLEYYRAGHPLSEGQLGQWPQHLEERRDWLAARGVAYLFVVAPNKDSVYPELVPARIHRARPDSSLDQLVTRLRGRSTVEVLDLRVPLRAAKSRIRVYQRTDSHWNDPGAFEAYRAIMERVAARIPQAAALPWSAFDLRTKTTLGGDLSHLIGLHDVVTEEALVMTPRTPRVAHQVGMVPSLPWQWHQLAMETGRPLPRAIVLHDSFM